MNSFGNFLLSGLSRYHSKNRLRSFSYDSSNRIFFSKILNSNLSWCLSRDFPQIQVSIPLGICPESSGSCHLKAPTDFFITVSYWISSLTHFCIIYLEIHLYITPTESLRHSSTNLFRNSFWDSSRKTSRVSLQNSIPLRILFEI